MSRTSIPRIRSVRFKAGGELRILASPRATASSELFAALEAQVQEYAKTLDGRLAGFALVVWGADGTLGATVHNKHTSPYVTTAIPTLAAEEIRAVYSKIQINRALGYEDDAS